MSVLHNVARGAQEATSKWQSCLGRLPSPLETTKMAFRRLWMARDRGAPHTQLGHPVTQAANGARIGHTRFSPREKEL